MKLPTREKAIEMLKEYKMPDNIMAHTMQVNKVANFLAKKINENGTKVNLELVDRASLLHDLDKHLTLETNNHSVVTREILNEKGFPELADAAANHMLENIIKKNGLKTIEEKIVYYADKRVNHDKIVPLSERFAYLRKRYGTTFKREEEIKVFEVACDILEKEIFKLSKTKKSLEDLDG
jgi:putative nucleotidyltransferase with HDIG domain